MKSVEEVPPEGKSDDKSYPPSNAKIKEIIHYIMAHKKLPSELPKTILDFSRDAKSNQSFQRHLRIEMCEVHKPMFKRSILITKDAKILTFSGVVRGVYERYINMLSEIFKDI